MTKADKMRYPIQKTPHCFEIKHNVFILLEKPNDIDKAVEIMNQYN